MSRQRWWCQDGGYATVAAVGLISAISSVLIAVVITASAVTARHQAQVAADLAAIAAAWAHYRGEDACRVAADIAAVNRAGLSSCTLEHADVRVEVQVRQRRARARAGPLDGASLDGASHRGERTDNSPSTGFR